MAYRRPVTSRRRMTDKQFLAALVPLVEDIWEGIIANVDSPEYLDADLPRLVLRNPDVPDRPDFSLAYVPPESPSEIATVQIGTAYKLAHREVLPPAENIRFNLLVAHELTHHLQYLRDALGTNPFMALDPTMGWRLSVFSPPEIEACDLPRALYWAFPESREVHTAPVLWDAECGDLDDPQLDQLESELGRITISASDDEDLLRILQPTEANFRKWRAGRS